jgi:hypothetical protein
MDDIMSERVDVCRPHIGIGIEIAERGKERGRILSLTRASAHVMPYGIACLSAELRVRPKVKFGIEQSTVLYGKASADERPLRLQLRCKEARFWNHRRDEL